MQTCVVQHGIIFLNFTLHSFPNKSFQLSAKTYYSFYPLLFVIVDK